MLTSFFEKFLSPAYVIKFEQADQDMAKIYLQEARLELKSIGEDIFHSISFHNFFCLTVTSKKSEKLLKKKFSYPRFQTTSKKVQVGDTVHFIVQVQILQYDLEKEKYLKKFIISIFRSCNFFVKVINKNVYVFLPLQKKKNVDEVIYKLLLPGVTSCRLQGKESFIDHSNRDNVTDKFDDIAFLGDAIASNSNGIARCYANDDFIFMILTGKTIEEIKFRARKNEQTELKVENNGVVIGSVNPETDGLFDSYNQIVIGPFNKDTIEQQVMALNSKPIPPLALVDILFYQWNKKRLFLLLILFFFLCALAALFILRRRKRKILIYSVFCIFSSFMSYNSNLGYAPLIFIASISFICIFAASFCYKYRNYLIFCFFNILLSLLIKCLTTNIGVYILSSTSYTFFLYFFLASLFYSIFAKFSSPKV